MIRKGGIAASVPQAQGSNVEAGRAVQLLADNQIKLLAAQNTASEKSTNSNSSGSIGIS